MRRVDAAAACRCSPWRPSLLALAARRWRCGSSRAPPPTRWSGRGSDTYQATERYTQRLRRRRDRRARPRATCQQLVLTDGPRPAARARGLPVAATCRTTRQAPRRRRPPVRASSRAQAGARSSTGPGTFINTAVNADQRRSSQAQARPAQAQAEQAARGGARAVARRGRRRRPSRQRLAERPRRLVYAQFARDLLAAQRCATGSSWQLPRINDPNFVSALVFDPTPRRGDAEGALRLPVPVDERGADPGPAAART